MTDERRQDMILSEKEAYYKRGASSYIVKEESLLCFACSHSKNVRGGQEGKVTYSNFTASRFQTMHIVARRCEGGQREKGASKEIYG